MDNALTQKLKQDLQVVVSDTEELIKATASLTGERIAQIRARAEESARVARTRLVETGNELGMQARAAAGNIDGQVRAHPYAAAGITAGIAVAIGLLAGLLIGRR